MTGHQPRNARLRFRQRVWEVLDETYENDGLSRAVNLLILSLILLNVVAVILSTVDQFASRYAAELYRFEILSIILFTLEYVARLWSCVTQPNYAQPVTGRLRFMAQPLSLVDLLAVLPFYFWFIPVDLRFLRALRLFRIFRVAKLGRYSASLRLLGRVLQQTKEELVIVLMVLVLLTVVASSLIYFAENPAQPDQFPDILTSMWWAIMMLTTVGHSDVAPVTWLGRVLAAIIAVLGIGMFALPTSMLGATFVEELQKRQSEKLVCPHCGREIDHPQ